MMRALAVLCVLLLAHFSRAQDSQEFTEVPDGTVLEPAPDQRISTDSYPKADVDRAAVQYADKIKLYLGAVGQQVLPKVDVSRVCTAKYATYRLPPRVYHNGQYCWTFQHWWNIDFTYVYGCGGNCNVSNPCPKYERYLCRPTNYLRHYYYVYCPGVTSGTKVFLKYVNLPQCCSCYKYVTLWYKPQK